MNARALIEAETPKKAFKSFPRRRYKLYPGDEVCRATGDTRYIIEACLDKLKEIDPAKYEQELASYDDLPEYLAGNVDTPADTDPEWYLFEHLFDQISRYCPPFTYFGFLEADGSVGCWPLDDMSMEMSGDRDKLTIQYGAEADWSQVTTPYLYLDNTQAGAGRDLYDAKTKTLIWSW